MHLWLHTTQLRGWLDRLQAGDGSAREELLSATRGRLERLARKMLKSYPSVRRWADTGDVLQNASLRLLRSLEKVKPDSTRAFFGLAAEQIRRELIDLARHFTGPEGIGHNHASGAVAKDDSRPGFDPPDTAEDWADLERWSAFHTLIADLPSEEREVVGLVFYHGWTQDQVAELFQVSERTVRRWWVSAQMRLKEQLRQMPDMSPIG